MLAHRESRVFQGAEKVKWLNYLVLIRSSGNMETKKLDCRIS